MLFRRGSTIVATLASAVIGVGALGVVSYSALTGKSLCSVVHACDGEKAATTVQASETKTETKSCCALKAAVAGASNTKCTKSASSCCKGASSMTSGVVALNAAYPIVVPASFYSEKSCCSSSFVKAASTTAVASSCCQGANKAAMIAASTPTATTGCCKAAQAQTATIAASNETGVCTKAASASGCCKAAQAQTATIAASTETGVCTKAASASGCCALKAAKCSGKSGVVAATSAYPVMIPAAFYSDVQVCPTTLVKSESCTKAVSSTCPMNDPGCCKGSGVRADGKPCCGKCVKTAETAATPAVATN